MNPNKKRSATPTLAALLTMGSIPASAVQIAVSSPSQEPAAAVEAAPPTTEAAAPVPAPAPPAAEAPLPAAEGEATGAELSDPPPIGELFPEGGEDNSLPADFTQTVTMKLLEALVSEGVLKKDKAALLLQQAEKEALAARDAAKAVKEAAKAEEDDALRVSHVPEAVRRQIKEEVRNEVMADLKPGGAISLFNLPKPTDENTFGGDFRLRAEHISYPEGNDNTGSFPNFNAINTGAPFDTAGTVFSPQWNTTENRTRFRYRLRIGGEWNLEKNLVFGARFATGADNSPVSVNQTVGAVGSGQGGGFSKYAIWLDRAFFRYTLENTKATATVSGGRFDNPFQASEIMYDNDLGFDGVSVKAKLTANKDFKPWITAGGFPIFNTDLNFSSNNPNKFESIDKYLYGAQAGADINIGPRVTAKIAGAYYDFHNVEGRASTPFLPLNANDAGDTDHTRPTFAQKGNTYRPLRTIIPDPLNNFGTSQQFQYFGLASKFKPVTGNVRVDVKVTEPYVLSFQGEYIKNTGFNREEIDAVAVNNRGPLEVDAATGKTSGGLGSFAGHDTAWLAGMKFGKAALQAKGDWWLGGEYRWVGSDSVVDGFADSNLGTGGTNVKGFVFNGRYALSKHTNLGFAWMVADNIAGPPLKNDFIQLDFNLKF
jgi:hypothetical protein